MGGLAGIVANGPPARMTVLFVSDAPTVSGAEHVMLGHVDALARRGHSSHVVLRSDNSRLVSALDQRGVPFTSTSFSRQVIRTTLNPLALRHFAQAFVAVRHQLRHTLATTRADVVHAVSYPASLYAAYALGGHQPLIWHEHNIKRLHAINKHLLRFTARRCARIVGPSGAVTTNLARAGVDPARLRTIYNGVDLERFVVSRALAASGRARLGLSAHQPAIALVGQLLPYKGHLTLIAAARGLLPRWPTLRVFFIGALENPPYERELRDAIEAAGMQGHVVFTGWRDDVHAIEQGMDVVVVPTSTPEPAALTLLEAMALSRPLVASRTGGTPELVEDGVTGLLVPPGDVRALGEAIARLLADRDFADQLGAAGRRRVEAQFTQQRHADAVLALYEEVRNEVSVTRP
jgi:glycosyltransferase involved in cell wall biosynthesis